MAVFHAMVPCIGVSGSAVIDVKCPAGKYAVAWMVKFLDAASVHNIVIQTDGEQGIIALAKAVAQERNRKGLRTALRETPRRSHHSRGDVERWVQSSMG